jgi:heparanase 1
MCRADQRSKANAKHHDVDSVNLARALARPQSVAMRAGVTVVSLLLWAGCHGGAPPARHGARVTVDGAVAVAEVSERFVSVAVDTAQLVGADFWTPHVTSGGGVGAIAPYDFSRPRLRTLARPLGHAWLRIGGTDADRTFYGLGATPPATPPPGYRWVLTRAELDEVAAFARALDFSILFTLDAGAGPRRGGAWRADNARALVAWAAREALPVGVWELGNEVGAFPITLGFSVDAGAYAHDMHAARTLVAGLAPAAKLAGPASAYWPIIGEVGGFLPAFARAGADVDILTWHFYPQQSSRCPVATRPAALRRLLDPRQLDEIDRWADDVEAARRRFVPRAQVWLDETSNAQCGGAPGISDAFVSSLWWLDELGKMARRGTPVVVRQALSGADYGLLSEPSLEPRPDYFATVLWRRLMGTRVLATVAAPRTLRAYAHCAAAAAAPPGAVTLLAINLDDKPATITVDGLGDGARQVWLVTADALDAPVAKLGGQPLVVGDDGTLPPLASAPGRGGPLVLPPTSYAFAVFPEAAVAACR